MDINNWRKLAEFIRPENIMIPDESRNFITLSNYVVKINSRGKCQVFQIVYLLITLKPRSVKLTVNSLINIDPSSNVIKNEKLMKDIAEIKGNLEYPGNIAI